MTRERRADVVYEGDMRFSVRTGTDRTLVYGDRAELNELSPVETILTALAACSAMDVVSIVTKKRQAIERYEISALANQRDEFPQVLTDVTVTHEVWGAGISETAIRRSIELSANKYCPVNAMLSAGETTVHHRYRIHDTGATGLEVVGEACSTGPYRRPEVVPS